MSPPSAQVAISVSQTALQFGSSRLSYESIYLMVAVTLFVIIIGLVLYIIFHAYHGRKKHKLFWKEVREAEEAVRRGFAVLKRDIEAELGVVQRAKLGPLEFEAKQKEMQLLKDLDYVQKYIGKEVWDIGQTDHSEL